VLVGHRVHSDRLRYSGQAKPLSRIIERLDDRDGAMLPAVLPPSVPNDREHLSGAKTILPRGSRSRTGSAFRHWSAETQTIHRKSELIPCDKLR
jgi:hypothetical protein